MNSGAMSARNEVVTPGIFKTARHRHTWLRSWEEASGRKSQNAVKRRFVTGIKDFIIRVKSKKGMMYS